MNTKDANTRYSGAAQFFHWLSALLVASAWLLGQLRDEFASGEPRRVVDFLHISAGQLIVAVLALRLIWRFIAPPLPMAPTAAGVWGDRAAKLAHIFLYVLLLAVPIAELSRFSQMASRCRCSVSAKSSPPGLETRRSNTRRRKYMNGWRTG